jgi:hypothetical protein
MAKFSEVYRETYANAEILASAVQRFIITEPHKNEYGSGNSLILTSITDNQVKVYLDESSVIGILQPYGSLVIKPEDGIFFDGIKLENLGLDAISASQITIRMARAKEV